MIIVENRLVEAFDLLPAMGISEEAPDGFKPVYEWGNEYHLIKLLKSFEDNGKTPYPLIYQVSNSSDQNYKRQEAEVRLSLILAVRNTQTEQLNGNRWAMTYKDILYPLASNIEQMFAKGSIFTAWSKEYTLTSFPNYGNGKENFTTDIWDALRFDTTITINNNCLTNIFFDI